MIDWEYCDPCGTNVQAFIYVETSTGGVLTWCAHCGKINNKELLAKGGRVTADYSDMIGG